jgi:four helix bundle protein
VTPAEFKARTRAFAIDVIRLVRGLPRTFVSAHIAHQLLRCGTSQAGNYRAACRARSKADFIAKMGIVEEELDESLFWFDLLVSSKEPVPSDDVKRLWAEADELLAMTVQSIRTARGGSR